ncbi:serine/threonine-protein kinase [Streptomyces sp. NPDC092369]|uniref:serine/threonine-protein kinase n=1 Tax=Streptomyces sp. NPDC092369 TaxID=3366015 RepID=UPI003805B6DF
MGDLGDGRYELRERLGGGGMGDVSLAWDRVLERTVVVKLLRPQHLGDQEMRNRFLREVRITAGLEHENIVRVYDTGWTEGEGHRGMFLVMERLDGTSLHQRIESNRRGLSVPDVVRWGGQICRALEAAHARGLVHRDLKPANVQITEGGKAVLLDFGIACFQEDDEGRTQITPVGWIVGTRPYMSPEQSRGERVSAASDLYSLGCVLYEMLTGRPPFTEDDGDVLWLHRKSVPVAPAARRWDSAIPQKLDELVMNLLEKRPQRRPASAAAVRQALREVASAGERQGAQPKSEGLRSESPFGADQGARSGWPGPDQGVPEGPPGPGQWRFATAQVPPQGGRPAPAPEPRAPRPDPSSPVAYVSHVERHQVAYEITSAGLVAGLGTFGLLLGAGGVAAGASLIWGLVALGGLLVVGTVAQVAVFDAEGEAAGCLMMLILISLLIGSVWLVAARGNFRWYADLGIGLGICVAVGILTLFAGVVGAETGVSEGAPAATVLNTMLFACLGCALFAVHFDFTWWTALLTGLGLGAGGVFTTTLLFGFLDLLCDF